MKLLWSFLGLTEHTNSFLSTYPVVFSHLSLQPHPPCTKNQQCFTTAIIRSFSHFEKLELPQSMFCHLAFTRPRIANWLKIFNQATSTCCSDDNKEKLSASLRRDLASISCSDRKSAYSLRLVILVNISNDKSTNVRDNPRHVSTCFFLFDSFFL